MRTFHISGSHPPQGIAAELVLACLGRAVHAYQVSSFATNRGLWDLDVKSCGQSSICEVIAALDATSRGLEQIPFGTPLSICPLSTSIAKHLSDAQGSRGFVARYAGEGLLPLLERLASDPKITIAGGIELDIHTSLVQPLIELGDQVARRGPTTQQELAQNLAEKYFC